MSAAPEPLDVSRGRDMDMKFKGMKPSRRSFLTGAAAAGAGSVAATVAKGQTAPDPAITELQDWQVYLGDGVDAAPYGMPSRHERHVVRRTGDGLTADNISSINSPPLQELDGIITPTGG